MTTAILQYNTKKEIEQVYATYLFYEDNRDKKKLAEPSLCM